MIDEKEGDVLFKDADKNNDGYISVREIGTLFNKDCHMAQDASTISDSSSSLKATSSVRGASSVIAPSSVSAPSSPNSSETRSSLISPNSAFTSDPEQSATDGSVNCNSVKNLFDMYDLSKDGVLCKEELDNLLKDTQERNI
mmetsp:Transcript_14333/g.11820  ORF Transcript_14333/g.11820 Transcript_14333/m.11820 type:complete len:142 (-) Transcript_14333:134-559(-)